jgi:hypothetical protein
MSRYRLLTRILRVPKNSVLLENMKIENGVLTHIMVHLDREDYPPSELAHIYHEDYAMPVTRSVWNAVTEKYEPDGAPPKKNDLTFD